MCICMYVCVYVCMYVCVCIGYMQDEVPRVSGAGPMIGLGHGITYSYLRKESWTLT